MELHICVRVKLGSQVLGRFQPRSPVTFLRFPWKVAQCLFRIAWYASLMIDLPHCVQATDLHAQQEQ